MDKKRGERIKQLMRLHGVSRQQLADDSGFSLSLISKIRRGHDFSTEVQTALCQLLHTTPNHIHGYSSHDPEVELIATNLARINNPQINASILSLLSAITEK